MPRAIDAFRQQINYNLRAAWLFYNKIKDETNVTVIRSVWGTKEENRRKYK
jgi:hypothetical protein